MKLNVFGSIRHTLQPSQLLHKLEDRSAKGLSVGIDPAGYKGLDLLSNKIADNKNLSAEEHAIHGLWREQQLTHSIVRPTKVLQDFLRQEGLSHEVTERQCPQSIGVPEKLNLTAPCLSMHP